jgi:NADH dehydrogenase FAD-containing subunit
MFCCYTLDFIKQDISRMYPDLTPWVKITLVEAGPALLGPFDSALQQYALGLFEKRDIDVRLGTAVIGVEDDELGGSNAHHRVANLSDGTKLPFGTMVWSAGLAPRSFTQSLNGVLEMHPRNKRIIVDKHLRVKGYEGSIWACGDAAVNEEGIVLPQLAQVARQQGIYLSKVLNGTQGETEKEYKFFSLGSMAFLGDHKGIYDGSSVGEPGKEINFPKIRGVLALLVWRSAYWGRQTSMVNKILIPMHWMKSFLFGRGKLMHWTMPREVRYRFHFLPRFRSLSTDISRF